MGQFEMKPGKSVTHEENQRSDIQIYPKYLKFHKNTRKMLLIWKKPGRNGPCTSSIS